MNTERKPPRYDAANINSNTRRPHAQLNDHDKGDFKSSRITRHKYDIGAGDSKNSKYNRNSDIVGSSTENNDGNTRDSRYDRTSYRPRRYDNDEKNKDYVNGGNTGSRYGRNNYNDRYENDRKDSNGNRTLSNGKGTAASTNAGSNTKPISRSDYRRSGDNAASSNATPAPAHNTNTTTTTTTTSNTNKRDELHDKPINKVVIHYKSDIASGSTWSKEKSGPTFADMVRMRNEAKAKAANADKATSQIPDDNVANIKQGKSTSAQQTTDEAKLKKKTTRDDESNRRAFKDKQESAKSAQDDESEHDSRSSHHDDDDDDDSISSSSHNEDIVEDEEENENDVEDDDEDEVEDEEEQHEANEEEDDDDE